MTDGKSLLLLLTVLGAAVAVGGCRSAVVSGLSEDQANGVMAALAAESIAATKEAEGGPGQNQTYRIDVASGDLPQAVSVLQAAELPKRATPGWQEVFGDPSLVPTATEERARLSAAVSGELARTIQNMDGVVDARVHMALPDTCELRLDEAAPRPRASVMIKRRAGSLGAGKADRAVDEAAIRKLVAGAAQGMVPEDVTVVQVTARPLRQRPPDLVRVGPWSVARGAAPGLKLAMGIGLLLHIALAAAVIGLLHRIRRLSRGPR